MSANPQPTSRLQEKGSQLADRPEPSFLETKMGQRFPTEAGDLLARSFGKRYRGAILFGSQATGEAGSDSDVDLMVLLEPPIRLVRVIREVHRALSCFEDSHPCVIQAIPVAWDEFEKQEFHFYRKVRSEGIQL